MDYEELPHLDQYNLSELDEEQHSEISFQARQKADLEIERR
jgi:hypothetical protein